MAAPMRFDKDGKLIPPGPAFGAATRQIWETDEARDERLTPDEGPYPQATAGEAVAAILEEVEDRRAARGIEDAHVLDSDETQSFIDRAIAGTAYAAGKVVAANEHLRPETLEAQHQRHLLAAYNGDIDEDDAQDLYDLGLGPPPDAAEHARLLAELEADDEDEDYEAA